MGPNRKDLDYLCIFNIFMIDSSKNKQKLVCSLVEPNHTMKLIYLYFNTAFTLLINIPKSSASLTEKSI